MISPKEHMEYLRNTKDRWDDVSKTLDPDDKFIEICIIQIAKLKKEMQNLKSKSPEDFLI